MASGGETATLLQDSSDNHSKRNSPSPSPDMPDGAVSDFRIKKASNSNSTYNLKSCIFILVVLFVFVVVLAIVFSAGVVVGRDLSPRLAPCAPNSSNGTRTKLFNWGDLVTIGGQTVPVMNWLDDQMVATNIKNNLE